MTIFTSALLSLALMFNAPDSAKLTETAEIPCKENYYGYEIDIGEIAGTMVAEELNEYKTEFKDLINGVIDFCLDNASKKHKHNYDYLTLEDIDFNDKSKISSYSHYEEYLSYEYNAKYDDVFSEVADTEYYNWCIRKKNTIYYGYIYINSSFYFEPRYTFSNKAARLTYGYDTLFIGNYIIRLDTIFTNTEYYWTNYVPGRYCEYIKQNIGRLLYETGEKTHNVTALPVSFSDDCGPFGIIIFVDDIAKYICTYNTNFNLLGPSQGFLKKDTPEHIKNMLETEYNRLYLNADVSVFERTEPHLVLKSLMPYNQIMYYMPLVMEWGA